MVDQLDGGIVKLRRLHLGGSYVMSGREDLWDEYCKLLREVKDLVREKKLAVWNKQWRE